jgi:N-methylhydantoinase A/oxoprolinase/acetone carboxylase beta subunit
VAEHEKRSLSIAVDIGGAFTDQVAPEAPHRAVECAVYRRDLLGAQARLDGPCVIEEYASTTVLFDADTACIAETGEIIVDVASA